jgi:hypothetical protein
MTRHIELNYNLDTVLDTKRLDQLNILGRVRKALLNTGVSIAGF